jgi:hypothetical protein
LPSYAHTSPHTLPEAFSSTHSIQQQLASFLSSCNPFLSSSIVFFFFFPSSFPNSATLQPPINHPTTEKTSSNQSKLLVLKPPTAHTHTHTNPQNITQNLKSLFFFFFLTHENFQFASLLQKHRFNKKQIETYRIQQTDSIKHRLKHTGFNKQIQSKTD